LPPKNGLNKRFRKGGRRGQESRQEKEKKEKVKDTSFRGRNEMKRQNVGLEGSLKVKVIKATKCIGSGVASNDCKAHHFQID
jgi:hypothetical protein